MPDQEAMDTLKNMIAKQKEIEKDWYNLKYQLDGIDKDAISNAIAMCRDGFQFAYDNIVKSN